MADQMITLISKEGEEFTVEREFSKMCNLVKITLEDNEEDNRIPLDAIPSNHIEWIIDFCRRHKFTEPDAIVKPIPSNDLIDYIDDPKDICFLNSLTLEQKCELAQDCDYLNIPSLVQLISVAIAADLRCKDFDEIKEYLKVDKDFTKAEEENYRKEYAWMLEDNKDN